MYSSVGIKSSIPSFVVAVVIVLAIQLITHSRRASIHCVQQYNCVANSAGEPVQCKQLPDRHVQTSPKLAQATAQLSRAPGDGSTQSEPDFKEPIGNHTVPMGRDVQLPCKINNLGSLKTAWLRVEDKGILTIHRNVITRNYRIGLVTSDDATSFTLTIKNVQPSDKGAYMCQINSVPMRYAIGYLDVMTAPVFDETTSNTTDQQPEAASVVTASEGSNATLSCRARGNPSPQITWRREDSEPILVDGATSLLDAPAKVDGRPTLVLSAVSRLSSGAYLCIASNGVPPAASKRQLLDVQYKPVLRLAETETRARLGQPEVRLVCHVELNPLGSYHWVRLPPGAASTAELADDAALVDRNELFNSDKFEIVIKQVSGERVQMELGIRRIERRDYGFYKCIARNSIGLQSNAIRLIESSSFSISTMFRNSDRPLSGGDSELTAQQSRQQTQNDQQDLMSAQVSDNRSPKVKLSGSSRAHARSSWNQPVSLGGQDFLANLQSVVGSGSSPSVVIGKSAIYHPTSLFLFSCFLSLSVARIAQAVAVVVVVSYPR